MCLVIMSSFFSKSCTFMQEISDRILRGIYCLTAVSKNMDPLASAVLEMCLQKILRRCYAMQCIFSPKQALCVYTISDYLPLKMAWTVLQWFVLCKSSGHCSLLPARELEVPRGAVGKENILKLLVGIWTQSL
jgi:hypothetical protein